MTLVVELKKYHTLHTILCDHMLSLPVDSSSLPCSLLNFLKKEKKKKSKLYFSILIFHQFLDVLAKLSIVKIYPLIGQNCTPNTPFVLIEIKLDKKLTLGATFKLKFSKILSLKKKKFQ
jgi:hypothetical protein